MSDREVEGEERSAGHGEPEISVVIPAYDEEKLLPTTFAAVSAAVAAHRAAGLGEAEVVVVDNASTDRTAAVARAGGARVVAEPEPGIGRARNAGARAALAPRIFFLDADTVIPPRTLIAVRRALAAPGCLGGAVATDYRPQKKILVPYLAMWALVARLRNMTQGIAQFATAEAFTAIGGYDVDLRMAEDTDFYWRLRDYAKADGGRVQLISEVAVVPSCRRLDQWPAWRRS